MEQISNLEKRYINTRNWIDSSDDWDCWGTLVNVTFNLRVPVTIGLVKINKGSEICKIHVFVPQTELDNMHGQVITQPSETVF